MSKLTEVLTDLVSENPVAGWALLHVIDEGCNRVLDNSDAIRKIQDDLIAEGRRPIVDADYYLEQVSHIKVVLDKEFGK
jgi:hypothetical protein